MPRLNLQYAPYAALDQAQSSVVCKFAKLPLVKGIVWWRMGLGKTRIALSLFSILLQRQSKIKFPSICIFIARPAFHYDLKEECRKIGMDIQLSSKQNNWFLSAQKPTILFVSFANLQSVIDEFHWIKRYLKLVIVDELYLYSNPSTERSRLAREICAGNNAIGLSGSILPGRDNFAIWGQLRALSLNSKVADHATDFRTKYQTSYKADFGSGECKLFQNKRGWEDRIFARLDGHISIRLPKKLNKTTETITHVPLTPLQKSLIKSLVKNFCLEYNGIEQEYKYVLQTALKIRGILNGWIETKKDGKRIGIEYLPSHKVTVLLDQISEIHGCHEQCIVWCAFRNDVEMLSRNCKIANLQMVGGKPFDAAAFRTGNFPIVFATLGSGASVNHFAEVAHSKFFSLGYKQLDYEQAKGRNDRRPSGTQHVANYGHIQCESSLDEVVFKHVQKTKETEEDFINAFIRWADQTKSS